MNSLSELRAAALGIFHQTLAALEVEAAVRAHLRVENDYLYSGAERFALEQVSRIVVIAIGKASVAMARAAESVLEERFTEGLVVTNAVTGVAPQRSRVLLGGHPIPNEQSIVAAETALQMLREADAENTLVLFLISGGGSALFEKPLDDSLTLADLQEVNRVLVGCGAVIGEMNVVRRALSAVKGGRLAEAAPRAQQISLYISDVNSDDLATVASGPTITNPTAPSELERIVARYELLKKFPPSAAALLTAAMQSAGQEALASGRRVHQLLLDNRRALIEAQRSAENDYGLLVEIADDLIEGDVEAMAREHLARLMALRARHAGRTVCLLSGGEVICPVRGNGQGGRNQEFVLRAVLAMNEAQLQNIVVLSAGTDGIDGHSPAAGALADAATIAQAQVRGLSAVQYLQNSDSFNFFNALGDALSTGPTGNNVRDLRVLLAAAL